MGVSYLSPWTWTGFVIHPRHIFVSDFSPSLLLQALHLALTADNMAEILGFFEVVEFTMSAFQLHGYEYKGHGISFVSPSFITHF